MYEIMILGLRQGAKWLAPSIVVDALRAEARLRARTLGVHMVRAASLCVWL